MKKAWKQKIVIKAKPIYIPPLIFSNRSFFAAKQKNCIFG
jgi:hypothetical protein